MNTETTHKRIRPELLPDRVTVGQLKYTARLFGLSEAETIVRWTGSNRGSGGRSYFFKNFANCHHYSDTVCDSCMIERV